LVVVGGDDPVAARNASLEHLRDKAFHSSPFSERRFHDTHYHCASCWKRIAEKTDPNAEHRGYVTIHRVQYEGFPPSYQYVWLCDDCFGKLRDTFGWKASTEAPPEISEEAHRAFQLAYSEYLKRRSPVRQKHGENEYASVSWVPMKVVALAKGLGLEMTEEAAEELLALNESRIREVMDGQAVQLIRELIASTGERS
jgi:hypothetical protein